MASPEVPYNLPPVEGQDGFQRAPTTSEVGSCIQLHVVSPDGSTELVIRNRHDPLGHDLLLIDMHRDILDEQVPSQEQLWARLCSMQDAHDLALPTGDSILYTNSMCRSSGNSVGNSPPNSPCSTSVKSPRNKRLMRCRKWQRSLVRDCRPLYSGRNRPRVLSEPDFESSHSSDELMFACNQKLCRQISLPCDLALAGS